MASPSNFYWQEKDICLLFLKTGRRTRRLSNGYFAVIVNMQAHFSRWPLAPKDPESTKSVIEFANKINAIPKIVFSKTLQKVDWNNTKLVKGNIVDEVLKLKQGTGRNLSVGGLSIAQACMKLSLIDEYWFLVQPVIVGKGRRLFDGVHNRLDLKLVDAKKFNSGVVALHYLQDRNN
jgi:dihydrofolate reductase